MSAMLARFVPDASEALKLAVRCQHIERWKIPRSDCPQTRAGYQQWRATLRDFHAHRAGGILRDVGYDDATIARVRALIRKERMKSDPEAQALEDVVALVFLENYLEASSRRTPTTRKRSSSTSCRRPRAKCRRAGARRRCRRSRCPRHCCRWSRRRSTLLEAVGE